MRNMTEITSTSTRMYISCMYICTYKIIKHYLVYWRKLWEELQCMQGGGVLLIETIISHHNRVPDMMHGPRLSIIENTVHCISCVYVNTR